MNNQLDRLKQATRQLLVEIDLNTDCMSNQIKRERIESQIELLEYVLGTASQPQTISSALDLRPDVLAFALRMEQRLREKDADKGQSWKSVSRNDLEVHASSKMLEIEYSTTKDRAAFHAVDLANYCMMIVDVSGALDEGVEIINGEPQL